MIAKSASDQIELIPLTDNLDRYSQNLSEAKTLHRAFRPTLPDDYERYMGLMFEEGAEMVTLSVGGVTKSLAVYRTFHTTFHGYRFYIDDLVTDEADRSRGYGKTILDWCEARARQRGCDFLDLESGVQRPRTHRFYFREGLTIFAFGFEKSLR